MSTNGQNLISPHLKGSNTLQFNYPNGKINLLRTGNNIEGNEIFNPNNKLNERILDENTKPIFIKKMNSIKDDVLSTNLVEDCDQEENALTNETNINSLPRLLVIESENSNCCLQDSPFQLRYQGSFKYYNTPFLDITPPPGISGSDSASQVSRLYSDVASMKSWTSIGMGSTDGKKMIVRKVPTSPVELFNIVNPST